MERESREGGTPQIMSVGGHKADGRRVSVEKSDKARDMYGKAVHPSRAEAYQRRAGDHLQECQKHEDAAHKIAVVVAVEQTVGRGGKGGKTEQGR